MAKKASARADALDDPRILGIRATTPNPEEAMVEQERIEHITRLRAALDLTPTPEDIFFICSTINEKGPGLQSRQTIAQHFHISENEAGLYIEWAEKIPKIKGKTPNQVVADIANLSAPQIPSLPRRLFL